MHLQRIVLPSGHVTWTAYDGDAIVAEIRVSMRPGPQRTYFGAALRVSRPGAALWILMSSFRISMPSSVKAMTP